VQGDLLSVVVRNWSAEAQGRLENRRDLQVEVYALGLEEIFLELHK
jgi:hypothetical protein